YRLKEEAALAAQDKARGRIWWLLLVGIVLNVVLAILLAMFFSKGITGRLRILTDNRLRLARGEALHPLLGGADEIASLDGDFHKMASELDKAMQGLKASEERTRLVIENMPVGVVTVDETGRIESINPRTEAIFDCKANELVGKNIETMLPAL